MPRLDQTNLPDRRDAASPHPRAPRSSAGPFAVLPRSAFTLIELILVIVLLGILASLTIPRFTGNEQRQAQNEVAAVETFLAAVAERDAFASEPIAITFDTQQGRRSGAAGDSRSGSDAEGVLSFSVRRILDPAKTDPPQWVSDPLIQPVTLSLLTLREAAADGQRLDSRAWRITLPQTEPRPAISLLLSMRPAGRLGTPPLAWQVDLPAESLSPVRTALGASGASHLLPPQTRTIDLDATGRGAQPW
jgi:prepilin-type N-terminal cleavage/methylation domain-containing protein